MHLPPELLARALTDLNVFDLESVAKTFNKTLYTASYALFKPHTMWVKNARRMCALFSPTTTRASRRLLPSFPGHLPQLEPDCSLTREVLSHNDCKTLGLDLKRRPYIRTSPPDLRNWMKLDGTFGWLEPLDDIVAEEMRPHTGMEGERPVAPAWQVDILVNQAHELGLTLPQGFETFLRSDRLHHRIPSYGAWYFRLSKLIKCVPVVDSGAGGYLVRFYCDQQFCAFAYLYMNPSGAHCVLVSAADIYKDMITDSIAAPNVQDQDQDCNQKDGGNGDGGGDDNESNELGKEDFALIGLTFEEYLATVYFDELLEFAAKPFQGLKDFAKHMYKSPIEVEPMRRHSK